MNVGEYGIAFLFSTGFNMQESTGLSLTFAKPDGTQLTVTDPAVSVGTTAKSSAPSTCCCQPPVDGCSTCQEFPCCCENAVPAEPITFAPFLYVQYVFQSGDVDQAGCWSARLTYLDATPRKLISDPGTFMVRS